MTLGRCWRLRGLEWGPPPPFQADRNATRAAITAEPWRLTFVASSSLAKKRGLGWGASSRSAELYGAQLVRGVTALALAVGCGSVDLWNNFTFGIVISLVIAAVMVIAGLMVISVPGMAASREMIREVTAMAETCDGENLAGVESIRAGEKGEGCRNLRQLVRPVCKSAPLRLLYPSASVFALESARQKRERTCMPTVLTGSGFSVRILSSDHRPSHVHVVGGCGEAVFFLSCPDGPPSLRENYGFKRAELNRVKQELNKALGHLCAEWRRIHGDF